MGFYQYRREQFIQQPMSEIWNLVSDPHNLKRLTPSKLNLIPINDPGDKMYPGMMISYKVSPILRIRMTWVTEITQVHRHHYFVDEQRNGPYKLWHHEHHFEEQDGGVLMTDIVSYQPPFGILGRIANSLFIRAQLKNIFDYRERAFAEIFDE